MDIHFQGNQLCQNCFAFPSENGLHEKERVLKIHYIEGYLFKTKCCDWNFLILAKGDNLPVSPSYLACKL